MEIDKSEHWLLQSVDYWTSPIGVLGASKKSVSDWFGYPGLDLAKDELIDVLHRLFQRGDLIAFETDSDSLAETPKFVPTRSDVEEGISHNQSFAYGVTSQGGQRWESAARADWTRFYQVAFPDEKSVMITGTDRDLIERSLAAQVKAQKFQIVNPVWQVFEPWHATYWKVLDAGYEVTYRFSYAKSSTPEFDQQPYPDVPEWFVEL